MGKMFDAMEKSGRLDLDAPDTVRLGTARQTVQVPVRKPGSRRKDPGSKVPGPDGPIKNMDDVFLDFVRRVPAVEAAKREPDEPKRTAGMDRLDPCMVSALNPRSIEAEQFRLLKNHILFPEKGDAPRSIMVTSPSPDEGKSFISANLAVSIAQSIDEYVLLMDCDLRGPSVHTLFGVGNSQGLSEHLSSAVPLSALLRKTFLEKLTLLPGGAIPPNPSELLSSEQMRRLLREVKARYSDRYVIIDTPPPQITSETNAIARTVDGIIIVVRQGRTRKKEVQDIVDIYGRQKILGVVKNFSTTMPMVSYRYKKYGYDRR